MGKKDLLSALLYYTGVLWLVARWNNIFSKNLVILAYHRVLPSWDESYPGDIELISASENGFDWQMQYLKKNCDVVSFSTIGEMMQGEKRKKNSVIVSFDDGFIDNYEVAYPILKKHQLPATFFVCTAYVGENKTFWFERLAEQIAILKNQYINFPMLDLELKIGKDKESTRLAIEKLLKKLKKVENSVRLEALNHLEQLTENQALQVDQISRPLTWQEVKELSENNIAIESHSHSHPILSNCSEAELEAEIIGSRQIIENKLDTKCSVISYPVGGEEAYDANVLKYLNTAKYSFGCTYQPGVNNLDALNEYQLRRIHVERYTSKARFVASIVLPKIFK